MNEFDRIQREVEADERWLRGLGEPAARPGLADRVKGAVRAEASRARGAGRSWARWQGVLAAAAMLAMCTTVIWRGSSLARARVERVRAVERFAASLERIDATDASLMILGEEIDAVCSSSRSELDASIDELGESIESAGDVTTSSM